MTRLMVWSLLSLSLAIVPAAAQQQTPTVQDSASAQPSIPKAMPNLTVPGTGASQPGVKPRAGASHHLTRTVHHSGNAAARRLSRPALANVELTEPLPHPPQPPHVVVPTPAYPLENFVTGYTTPPPPVVCVPTRRDRFQPDYRLVGEAPVLCTADNP